VFEKLRRDSTFVCMKTLQRSIKVKESLEDSKDKLSRSSAFSVRSHSSKGRRGGRTLWRSSEFIKLSRDNIFICAGEVQSQRARKRNRTKVETFEKLEFFQVWEERVEKLRRRHSSRPIRP
jgi:hypothetical protein